MDYRRFGDTLVLRLDPGEEIVEQVTELARRENIRLAEVSGLGAVGQFSVGSFAVAEKKYYSHDYAGNYEIVSLTGTVTEMDGKVYLHLHMSAGAEDGAVVGGHLTRAVISATGELVVRVLDGRADRGFSPEIGLNLLKFDGE